MNEIEIPSALEPDYTHLNCNTNVKKFENLSYEDFFENYLIRNMPCIIKNISFKWESTSKWVYENRINVDYLNNKYGDLKAPVAYCSVINYNSQCKTDMLFHNYISYLKIKDKSELLYLKDWHLRRQKPNDKFYETPKLFASDWLNEYSVDNKEDDYMFVYIGPKDSWTPLHADVYSSYSWSVNIVGRKKWILFPPGEEKKFQDPLGNLPLMFKPNECDTSIKYIEIVQENGDAIFVPSGWYHQVVNEVDTISINHNWINGCNIEVVWNALLSTLCSVENEIIEFKETPEYPMQCQVMLKALFGMDCAYFINFLCYMGNKRLTQLKGSCKICFDNFEMGINHIVFDLKQILKVMQLINSHSIIQNKCVLSNIKYDFIDVQLSIAQGLN